MLYCVFYLFPLYLPSVTSARIVISYGLNYNVFIPCRIKAIFLLHGLQRSSGSHLEPCSIKKKCAVSPQECDRELKLSLFPLPSNYHVCLIYFFMFNLSCQNCLLLFIGSNFSTHIKICTHPDRKFFSIAHKSTCA
jgi:hypothetical protein